MSISNSNITEYYDNLMYERLVVDLFEGSNFNNFGYWTEDTNSQRVACENLVEKLLAFIPQKQGHILDVACGQGATTRHLLKYYAPSQITAVNISTKQLQTAKKNAPGCTFLQMDAAKMEFTDNCFDHIICVEAAFHFHTRYDFLREAWRILKPGGHLVLSDVLLSRLIARYHSRTPAANWVKNLAAYKALYAQLGFAQTDVLDETNTCWHSFRSHYGRWLRQQYQAQKITLPQYLSTYLVHLLSSGSVKRYCIVHARKV